MLNNQVAAAAAAGAPLQVAKLEGAAASTHFDAVAAEVDAQVAELQVARNQTHVQQTNC